jgi:polyisoprenyl-teichoic acid--peptidoglycan teichoic acid transferase
MTALPDASPPPRPGLGLLKRFALGALAIVVLAAAATATAALLEVKNVADIIKHGEKIPGVENVLDNVEGGGPQTVLVLGSDRRFADIKAHNPVRSDTLMLVRLDPSKAATAVMSIPRDLKVQIPGFGTNKINAAYAFGGAKLTVETVKQLFHFPINHVVNVNFGGFKRAVNRLGCVYVDVDRRYFNDNHPPVDSPSNYATIDIQPGYQKLCGSDALDYVRFRHLDDDFVRSARQQGFLRQAKDQFGLGKLFGSRTELLKIFSSYTQTDIRSPNAVLKLLKLAFESSGHPIRTVHFNHGITPDLQYAVISPQDLQKARDEFLNAQASTGPPPTRKRAKSRRRVKHTSPGLAPGLIRDQRAAEDYVADASTRTGFPVYYPADRLSRGSYAKDRPRAYDIYDRAHHRYRAYRMVVSAGEIGQYYGVQGMTWKAPPILDNPSETRKLGRRKLELFFDGSRLRLVAFQTPRGVYWVSNTLSLSLTNKQMLDIARSLRRVGS